MAVLFLACDHYTRGINVKSYYTHDAHIIVRVCGCMRARADAHNDGICFISTRLPWATPSRTKDADFVFNNALLVSSKQTEAEIARQQEEYVNILREQANLLADGLLLKHDNPLANFVFLSKIFKFNVFLLQFFKTFNIYFLFCFFVNFKSDFCNV